MMEVMVLVKSMIKNIFNYIRHSDISIAIYFNPLRWRYACEYKTKSEYDPGLIFHGFIDTGLVRITIFIDDGSW